MLSVSELGNSFGIKKNYRNYEIFSESQMLSELRNVIRITECYGSQLMK